MPMLHESSVFVILILECSTSVKTATSERCFEPFEFFTLGVSVRLSDRSNVTQNKVNFVKNYPQWATCWTMLISRINRA